MSYSKRKVEFAFQYVLPPLTVSVPTLAPGDTVVPPTRVNCGTIPLPLSVLPDASVSALLRFTPTATSSVPPLFTCTPPEPSAPVAAARSVPP